MKSDSGILARNHVHVSGRGEQYMIFAPGYGCDQHMWRAVAPAFEDKYRVVLFDYVGVGNSDMTAYDPERYGTLAGYAEDVLDICGALGIEDAVFVGHSVGGMIGLLASVREPRRFSRLIMVGPSPRYLNDPPDYTGGFERSDLEGLLALMEANDYGWAGYLAGAVMQNPDRPELAKELEASFCAMEPSIARRFANATFFADNRADLQHVVVPSLILQCSGDLIAPVEVGEYMHLRLPGSRLVRMEATGHCPHVSHPEETVRLIRDYLSTDFAQEANVANG